MDVIVSNRKGNVMVVQTDAAKLTCELKALIKECFELRCPAHSIQLHVGKTVQGGWVQAADVLSFDLSMRLTGTEDIRTTFQGAPTRDAVHVIFEAETDETPAVACDAAASRQKASAPAQTIPRGELNHSAGMKRKRQDYRSDLSSNDIEVKKYRESVCAVPDESIVKLNAAIDLKRRTFQQGIDDIGVFRRPFVLPVLEHVVDLFDKEDKLCIRSTDIHDGTCVGAHCFTISRDVKQSLYVVEVPSDDMTQGINHAVNAMKVEAARSNSKTAYAIVSTFRKWIFLKSTTEKLLIDRDTCHCEEHPEDIQRIAGKVYSILVQTNVPSP